MRRTIQNMFTVIALGSLPPVWAENILQQYDLKIDRQPVRAVLDQFSQQTDLNISLVAERANESSIEVGPVNGRYTADAALSAIVAGTGLVLVRVNETTIAVVEESPSKVRLAKLDMQSRPAASALHSASERVSTRRSVELSGVEEEVIVTAQKREENIQDVPISISVLSGGGLDRSTFSGINDALRTVPGVAMYENSQAGMSKIAIRGVASNASLFNGSSVVGYYLDEIPFAFVRYPVTPDVGSFDLERVEVLRGPQGTLYGASSLNGVVRVLTQDADLDKVEVKVRSTVSSTHDGGENYRGDAAVNIPVIQGKFAVRGVVGYADESGWIDLPLAGLKDINDGKKRIARLKANAAPTENFGIEALAWISRDDRGSSSISRDDRTLNTRFPQAVENDYDAYGLTMTYDFPAVSLLSASSYMDLQGSSLLDAPLGLDTLLTVVGAKLMSEEIRLTSTGGGPWAWSLGGIYRDAEDRRYQDPFFDVAFRGVGDNVFTSESFALFGQVTRRFLDERLEITGGVRYFEDKASSNERAAQTAVQNATDSVPYGRKTDKFDAVTPRVVVAYHPSADTSLYASYAQGFRSGFSQIGDVLRLVGAAPAVEPDRLNNYELGAKGSAAGGRLTYDVSAYYVDWKDSVQVLLTVVNGAGFNGAVNSQGIDGFGADFGTTLQLRDSFEAALNISWNDLQFVDDVFSGTNLLYPKGSRPPESSELTASAMLSHTLTLPGDYSGRFSGAVDFVSELLTPGATAATAQRGDSMMIARSSFTLEAPAGWSATLFVDNLTDEDGKIRPVPVLTPAQLGQSDRLRPRTYGLQLDYHFE